nr:NAD-dependent epimerase/dehydratase family protein [uncultured Acetatifactor sp.]
MKRILITGVHSYIGNAMEKYLREWNQREGQEAYQVGKISLRNGEASLPEGFDVLLHVAGIAHADTGRVAEETKRLYYRINRDLTVETAKRAREAGIPLFIYLSSVIVYGDSAGPGKSRHITADTEPEPANFYGESKYQAELELAKLRRKDFHVAVLRLPMVYGQGSKGNFPMLVKLARSLPVFPDIDNRRSVIYVEHLAEFIRLLIESGEGGLFFPQNEEYASTAQMVKAIGEAGGKKVYLMRALNPVVKICSKMPGRIGQMTNKAFGSFTVDPGLNQGPEGYRKYTFLESIRKSV